MRHERAFQILDRALLRDCVLTLQALAEFFHVTTRRQMMARTDAAAQLHDWATEFPTVTANPEALFTALQFTVGGRFSWWDALLMATAERHGCEMQDGSRLGGLTVLDPFVGDDLPGRVGELLE